MSIAAVGDIHGELAKLEALLARPEVQRCEKLIFLGDYVDGGSDSRAVISRLIELRRERPETIFLLGNHDRMMREFCRGNVETGQRDWLLFGGWDTLASYGVWRGEGFVDRLRREGHREYMEKAIPEDHRGFLGSLIPSHAEEIDGMRCVFVHAGVNPSRTLEENTWQELLDPGKQTAFYRWQGPWKGFDLAIYGHRVYRDPAIEPNKIGIDTGCGNGGDLTAMLLPERRLIRV